MISYNLKVHYALSAGALPAAGTRHLHRQDVDPHESEPPPPARSYRALTRCRGTLPLPPPHPQRQ